jgi:hypothetical protein
MPLSQGPAPDSSMAATSASVMPHAISSSLPVAVPPLVASIWGPLPNGRPSTEWQPPQGAKLPGAKVSAPEEQQLPPKKLPVSPGHRQCSAC